MKRSAIGLGCMGMSTSYGDHEACATMATQMTELAERFKGLLTGEA